MSVEIDPQALREEEQPTRAHATPPRPVTLTLPVAPENYQVRLTSAQFLELVVAFTEANGQRRRLLEQFQVDAIGKTD